MHRRNKYRTAALGLMVVVGLCALSQVDDSLSPQARLLLDKSQVVHGSNAFLYLLGMGAAPGTDPLEAGERTLAAAQQVKATKASPANLVALKLPLPKGPLFCHGKDQACLGQILSSDAIAPVLAANETLLVRYQTFLAMSGFHTQTRPSYNGILPPYSYLIKGNRLVMLKAIHLAQEQSGAAAIKLLTATLAGLRLHLREADTLIGKMVYADLMSQTIDVLSTLHQESGNVSPIHIQPLSPAERNLELPLSREFAGAYYLLKGMDRNPEFFEKSEIEGGHQAGWRTPGWLVRLVYKPNMTINSEADTYAQIIQRNHLTQQAFAKAAKTPAHDEEALKHKAWHYLRNAAGTVLSQIGRPDDDDFIARLWDLDSKIALFNDISAQGKLPVDPGTISNPYYDHGKGANYSSDGKELCLEGPLKDAGNIRCLRVKI